jgi:predicted TIM-barrel fold metal-dependent hydrolase
VLELNGTYESWHETANMIIAPAAKSQIFGLTAAKFYRINE